MFIIGFIVGTVVGAFVALIIYACVIAGSEADEEMGYEECLEVIEQYGGK